MKHAEISALVNDFLQRGGTIIVVPFGVSGQSYGFRACARSAGRWGLLRRFGLTQMPPDAHVYVLTGDLSVAAARAQTVWHAIARRGEVSIEDLHRELRLARRSVEQVIDILLRIGALEKIPVAEQRVRYRAIGTAPAWSDFLDERRAA